MTFGPIRIGWRTLKTALAVMICITLFHLLDRSTPMIACLAAVFAMREDVSTTIYFGFYRIIGNLLGGSLALVYFYVYRQFNHSFYVQLLMIPLLVTTIIVFSDAFHFNPGIVGACATLFIIVLTVPETETFWYAVARIMDTVIGTVVALAVNQLILPQTALKPEHNVLEEQAAEINLLKKQLADYQNEQK